MQPEDVIKHPVQRRIILWLMTFGNAGIITGITSLLLGFVSAVATQTIRQALILVVGYGGDWFVVAWQRPAHGCGRRRSRTNR